MVVRLVPVDRSNWRAATAVAVTPKQLRFVADHQPVALVILAKSFVRSGGLEWEPLAIIDEDERIVGVLALAHGGSAAEIFHLAVDAPLQGRGIGAAALQSIVGWTRRRRPEARTLVLTVHPENERARRLYTTAGFAPTGEFRHGEPEWARRLIESRAQP